MTGGCIEGRILRRAAGVLLAGALAGAGAASAAGAPSGTSDVLAKQPATVAVQQCLTSGPQTERAATFSGEMQYLPGTAKMQMRIDVLERLPPETSYHVVAAPGLGVWRSSDPGVKSYKYLKEVTNLDAPASYRAAVRFRWLNAKGRMLRTLELRTQRCWQPAAEEEGANGGEAAPGGAATTGSAADAGL